MAVLSARQVARQVVEASAVAVKRYPQVGAIPRSGLAVLSPVVDKAKCLKGGVARQKQSGVEPLSSAARFSVSEP